MMIFLTAFMLINLTMKTKRSHACFFRDYYACHSLEHKQICILKKDIIECIFNAFDPC